MAVTRFGLQIPSFTFPGVDDADLFARISTMATTAEHSGFDSLWVMDHFYQIVMVGPADEPMLEAYATLSALAARTSEISLGALVTGVTYRNPALLAKMVTTLDVISSGRAILGIGAAWNDEEHRGYGFGFPSTGERMDRLEETVQICRAMFTQTAPSFKGTHYEIDHALNSPRPVRAGGIPILIGGGGEKRTLAIVARYGDACNLFGDRAEVIHKLDVLERHCADVGRDPAEITKTKLATVVVGTSDAAAQEKVRVLCDARGIDPAAFSSFGLAGGPDTVCEEVAKYFDAGLDGMIFNLPDAHDLASIVLLGDALTRAFGPRTDGGSGSSFSG